MYTWMQPHHITSHYKLKVRFHSLSFIQYVMRHTESHIILAPDSRQTTLDSLQGSSYLHLQFDKCEEMVMLSGKVTM